MEKSRLLKFQIIVAFFLLLTTTLLILSIYKNDKSVQAEESISCYNAMPTNTDLIRYEVPNEIIDTYPSPETPLNATYKKFETSMTQLNVVINFINYVGDETNNITSSEIANVLEKYEEGVNKYFGIMSYNNLKVVFDYVVTTTSYSYEELKAMDANYSIEIDFFNQGITNCLDEDGLKKDLAFSIYHEKINFFAGNAGKWNTFLWPHSWGEYFALITLMEDSEYDTFIHETFHFMGLPDLYSYRVGNSNMGVGYLDMMASNYSFPVVNAYFREEIGWIDSSLYNDGEKTQIEVIPATQTGTLNLSLYRNTYSASTSNTIAYKFGENASTKEFFVMEYRVKNSENMNNLGNSGIVIYRVHSTADGNANAYLEEYYAEIIFMGDLSLAVNSYYYVATCIYGVGATCNSLVYTSGVGYSKIVSGENSNISVKVNSMDDLYANVTITFPESSKEILDLVMVDWNYNSSSPWYYSGSRWDIRLINLPSTITPVYIGTTGATTAGNYSIRVSLRYDTDKYELINCNFATSLNWEIKKRVLDLSLFSWDYGGPFTYNKEFHSVNLVNSYSGLSITYTNNSFSNAGDYTASAECNVPPNTYKLNGEVPTLNWSINASNISIKINHQTSIYGQSLNFLTYSITSGNVYEGDDLNISLNKVEGKTVGNYSITGNCLNPNYNVTFTKGNYSITKAKILVLIHNKTSSWGEELKELTYEITSGTIYYEDNLNIVISKESGLNVGNYSITGDYLNPNYNVTFSIGNYSITKAKILVLIHDKTSSWGEELKELTYEITSGTIYYEDNLNIVITKTGENTVGNYLITGAYSNSNYNVTFTNGNYCITQANISILIHDKSSIWGEELKELTYEITAGQIFYDDNLNIVLTKEDGLDVGRYAITAEYNNSNYNITFTNGIYTIYYHDITYKISNTNFIYNGEFHWFNIEVFSPIVYEISYGLTDENYNFTSPILTDDFKNANILGTIVYIKIQAESCETVFTSTRVIINPYNISLIVDNKTSVYGESLKLLTYTLSAMPYYDDNLNINVQKAIGTQAGEYAIIATYSNPNYNITISNGKYTINKRNIMLEIDNQTSVYGDSLKTLTYSLSTEPLSGDYLNINIHKTTGIQAGEYEITATYSNANYNITITNGKYIITKRNLLLEIENQTSVYGEKLKTLTYILSAPPYDKDDLKISIKKEMGTQVGDYKLSATYDNPNYNITVAEGNYKILKRNIIVKLNDQIKIEGEDITINQNDYELDLENGYSILLVDLPKVKIYTEETDISIPKSYNLYFAINNPNYNIVVTNNAKLIVQKNYKNVILIATVIGGPVVLTFVGAIWTRVSKYLLFRKWN